MNEQASSRICREVQAQLPDHVAGHLSRRRRWLVNRHLRRCTTCRQALERQRSVAEALQDAGAQLGAPAPPDPPDDLLDTLLTQARQPGLRARAAVPFRGAVSGARPALTTALLVAGALTGTAIGYAGWRGAHRVRGLVRRR